MVDLLWRVLNIASVVTRDPYFARSFVGHALAATFGIGVGLVATRDPYFARSFVGHALAATFGIRVNLSRRSTSKPDSRFQL